MRHARLAMVMVVVTAMTIGLAITAGADGHIASGTFVPGNADCGENLLIKIDPVPSGETTYDVPDGSIKIDVYWVDNDYGKQDPVFDWSVRGLDISAVAVKGGPDTMLYTGSQMVGLHAPGNTKNKNRMFFGLSHISFCGDKK